MTGEELGRLFGRRYIAFHPELAEIGGDACAGLFLSQAIYWGALGGYHPDGNGRPSDGWFYHTLQEWHAETFIGRRDMDRVRTIWRDMGVLQERMTYLPTRLWYRVNLDVLAAIISDRARQSVHSVQNDLYTPHSMAVHSEQPYTIQNVHTDTTTESTTPSLYTGAHAQSSFVEGPPSLGTGKKVPGTGNGRSTAGKSKVDLTLPPTKYRVSAEMWEWAQRAGWRASRDDLQNTADTCFDHFRGKGEARADWIATLRTWVSRNIEEGKDLKLMQRRSTIQNIENGGSNGRGGPGQGLGQDRPRYGYNRAGEPTNRSTAIIETARSLARTQAARELETGGPEYVETQRTREDRLRDSPGPGEQLRGDIDESDR